MSNAKDHLVPGGSDRSASLDLSARTGLARLQLERRHLTAGEHLQCAPGSERFLYVLEGSGVLHSAAETVSIETGDFVALSVDDSAELSSESGISIFFGQSGKA